MPWKEGIDVEVVDGAIELTLTQTNGEKHLVASITPQTALILGKKLQALGLPAAPAPEVPEALLHHLDDMRRLALKAGDVNYTERGKH